LPIKKEIGTMDSWAIIEEPKIAEQLLNFKIKEEIETMDRLAIIEEPKIVETTVRISN